MWHREDYARSHPAATTLARLPDGLRRSQPVAHRSLIGLYFLYLRSVNILRYLWTQRFSRYSSASATVALALQYSSATVVLALALVLVLGYNYSNEFRKM